MTARADVCSLVITLGLLWPSTGMAEPPAPTKATTASPEPSVPVSSGNVFGASKWGMSLKEISRMFPGGATQKDKAGAVSYTVEAPGIEVAEMQATFPMVVSFSFPRRGLQQVSVYLLEPGTKPDIAKGVVTFTSREHAAALKRVILRGFDLKYGHAGQVEGPFVRWTTSDHTEVSLCVMPGENTPDQDAVSIVYEPEVTLLEAAHVQGVAP